MQLKKPIGATLAAATCSLLGTLPVGAGRRAGSQGLERRHLAPLLRRGQRPRRGREPHGFHPPRVRRGPQPQLHAHGRFAHRRDAERRRARQCAADLHRPSGGGSYIVAPGEQPLDTTFLDTRIALAASWQQSLGNAMRWSVGFSGSDEYDYLHLGVDARLERDFNMQNTTAFVGVAYGQDDIKPVGGTPIGLAPMAGEVEDEDGDDDGEDRGRNSDDSKDVADLLIGVTQVLSRRSLARGLTIPTARATAT